MTVFLFCLVLILGGTNVFTLMKFSKVRNQLELGSPTLERSPGKKAIANPRHQLKKTFNNRRITRNGDSGQDFHGWHYWCTCDAIAPAIDNDPEYVTRVHGTEAGAIRAWKRHVDLYAELVDGVDNELEKCKKELQEHIDSCICKDL